MSPLQQRLIEDLQLPGMSARTRQVYVRTVRQLAQHYHNHKPPDRISDVELRKYFLLVKSVKQWSHSGTTIALCGLKFSYENTLQRSLATLQLLRPAREKDLPVFLGGEEVRLFRAQVRSTVRLVLQPPDPSQNRISGSGSHRSPRPTAQSSQAHHTNSCFVSHRPLQT
jgi:integrase/recombinase XerD